MKDETRFFELTDGFHLRGDNTSLSEHELLRSSDPWEVLAGVLMSCQHGDFSQIARLKPLMHRCDSYLFWSAASELAGAAGGWSFVSEFFSDLSDFPSEHAFQVFATRTLGNTCDLRAVALFLKLHEVAEDEDVRYQIEKELSFLLEKENSDIWLGATEERIASDENLSVTVVVDRAAFQATVMATYDELIRSTEGAVFEGRQLDVRELAQRIIQRLAAKVEQDERLERERMVFEATTGVNLSKFVDSHGLLRVLPASKAIEEFLQRPESHNFFPGRRYFFGHDVQD